MKINLEFESYEEMKEFCKLAQKEDEPPKVFNVISTERSDNADRAVFKTPTGRLSYRRVFGDTITEIVRKNPQLSYERTIEYLHGKAPFALTKLDKRRVRFAVWLAFKSQGRSI